MQKLFLHVPRNRRPQQPYIGFLPPAVIVMPPPQTPHWSRPLKPPKEYDPRAAFGQVVRRLREGRGLSKEKLAELAGIHRTYIGDVERGARNIALVNMTRIAKALGTPLSRLITEMEK